jgi:hypothetical protein
MVDSYPGSPIYCSAVLWPVGFWRYPGFVFPNIDIPENNARAPSPSCFGFEWVLNEHTELMAWRLAYVSSILSHVHISR